uniref:Arthropod-like defensin 1 n=1 Tax=Mytilus coruscus TaxID=42192 RepID=A0A8F6XYE1_MYTCO|nr:arthropod-like defensin 1 [Mytilus coruscus]
MQFGRSCLLFGLLVAVLVTANGNPLPEEPHHQLEELEIFGRHAGTDQLVRIRRASCDLFGFQSQWVTPGNSVCAAHCIALGNRGGSCKGTVCHCRK